MTRGDPDLLEALYAIRALAQTLTFDPAHEFDRTAIVVLIEREAQRAIAIVGAEGNDRGS